MPLQSEDHSSNDRHPVRAAAASPEDPPGLQPGDASFDRSAVYAGIGIAVPLFGLATASSLGVLGDAWLITSILLTTAAAGLLLLLILPAQNRALNEATGSTAPTPTPVAPHRLAMLTGLFNLLWATVTVLMIIRPGSTTGA